MSADMRAAAGLTLRRAQLEDAHQVAEVMLASRRAFMAYAKSPHTDTETRAWVKDVLFANEEVFVALMDGTVIGIMSIQRSTNCGAAVDWLNQMYLHPAHVNQGTGSTLLALALRHARAPLRLFTFQQNTGARRFYERHGFKAIAFSDGHDNEEACPDVLYEITA
jgi:GNAT superfamily N-acetyltransferase